MQENNDLEDIKAPEFKNIEEECNFWKKSAKKWKAKYENAKRLYADVLYKSKHKPLKIDFPSKSSDKNGSSKDPFVNFDSKIQSLIVNHLNNKDLIKMTEVSQNWKKIIENNCLLSNIKLKIDLNPSNIIGEELMKSLRQYKFLEIIFSSNELINCFKILYNFSQSLEEIIFRSKKNTNIKLLKIDFPKLKVLKFTSFINDNICKFLRMSKFDRLEVLHIKRFRHSESLVAFLYELPCLTELYIAADSEFYNRWIAFEREKTFEPKNSLKILHVEIIDCEYVNFMPLFLPHANTIKNLKFSGICKFGHVMWALINLRYQLESLFVGFSSPDESEDENENLFDTSLEPHLKLEQLMIFDVDIISFDNFKTLLLYIPNLRELHIFSIVTREIMEQIIMILSNLKTFICCEIEDEAMEYFNQMKANNSNGKYNTYFDIFVVTDE